MPNIYLWNILDFCSSIYVLYCIITDHPREYIIRGNFTQNILFRLIYILFYLSWFYHMNQLKTGDLQVVGNVIHSTVIDSNLVLSDRCWAASEVITSL